jgi:hypothetical protein
MVKAISNRTYWIILTAIAGIALRTVNFAGASSMWYDELTAALNVSERSYYQLITQPLDYNQVASIGFLLITKLFTSIFGEHDFAFRFWPWLCSVLALYFYYQIARLFLKENALLAAFILFAFATSGWYYAAQAKQYACDITSSLFLVWAALELHNTKITYSRTILLSVAGFIFISTSMPAVALSGGLLCLLLLQFIYKTNQNTFRTFFIIAFTWTVACAWVVYHAKFVLNTDSVDAMTTYWSRGFVPLTGVSDALLWLINRIRNELGFFVYFYLSDIWPAIKIFSTVLLLLAVPGIIKLIANNKIKGLILLSPFFLAVLLSLFRILPYDTRVVLYASWPLLIAAVAGAEWLSNVSLKKIHPFPAKAFIILIALPMPIIQFLEPRERPPFYCQPAEPVLKELKKQLQPGDIIYVYYKARHAMKVYGHKQGITNYKLSGFYDSSALYFKQIDSLKGNNRVWFFTTHWTPKRNGQFPDTIQTYMAHKIGKEIKVINDPFGAYEEKECACTATLYDLTTPSRNE